MICLEKSKRSVRLTPPCVVNQAVNVSVTLHCDCDQSLRRDNHTLILLHFNKQTRETSYQQKSCNKRHISQQSKQTHKQTHTELVEV